MPLSISKRLKQQFTNCRDGVEKMRYRDLFTLPSGEAQENLQAFGRKAQAFRLRDISPLSVCVHKINLTSGRKCVSIKTNTWTPLSPCTLVQEVSATVKGSQKVLGVNTTEKVF